MNRETFTLSQKELQRAAVISSCIKGNLACARAAELLDLTPRHIKRLKARYRQGGEEALAVVKQLRERDIEFVAVLKVSRDSHFAPDH
jgi:Helix-turn-helix domain